MNAPDLIERIENFVYDDISLGQSARTVRTLTLADIQAFAAVSGDLNPTHLQPSHAGAGAGLIRICLTSPLEPLAPAQQHTHRIDANRRARDPEVGWQVAREAVVAVANLRKRRQEDVHVAAGKSEVARKPPNHLACYFVRGREVPGNQQYAARLVGHRYRTGLMDAATVELLIVQEFVSTAGMLRTLAHILAPPATYKPCLFHFDNRRLLARSTTHLGRHRPGIRLRPRKRCLRMQGITMAFG